MENAVYDEDGQLLTGSFQDYAMPRAHSFPDIGFVSHPAPATTNPLGTKGCGEAGCAGALVCVMNAIVDALSVYGIRHIDMPASPCAGVGGDPGGEGREGGVVLVSSGPREASCPGMMADLDAPSPCIVRTKPIRGHLSRPACSHVKQIAKRPGTRVPGSNFGRDFLCLERAAHAQAEKREGSVLCLRIQNRRNGISAPRRASCIMGFCARNSPRPRKRCF